MDLKRDVALIYRTVLYLKGRLVTLISASCKLPLTKANLPQQRRDLRDQNETDENNSDSVEWAQNRLLCVCACMFFFGTFDMKILCNQSHAEQSVTVHSCCCDTDTRLAHQWDILVPLTPDDDTIRCTLRHRDHGGCGSSTVVRDLPGISVIPGRGAAFTCRPSPSASLKAAPPIHRREGDTSQMFTSATPTFQNCPAPLRTRQCPLRKRSEDSKD